MDDTQRKKGIRRTAIIMALIATAFYFGFMLLSIVRS